MSNKKEIQKILDQVLKKIKPSSSESKKLKKLCEKTLEIANKEVSKVNAKVILAGSMPRDTWLRDKNEFDIFIIFPKNYSTKEMESLGLKIGKIVIQKLNGKWRIDYAQHPYIRGKVGKVDVDIVPCYQIQPGEKIISAVDRTPFHVEYLNKKLPKKLVDDVRLLKQFLKANEIYGADAKTEGFSGYLCELLIINSGSFLKLLEDVVDWKIKEIIDIEKLWKEDDYRHLRKKFKNEVLIVIDPVDKDRNVAAPVSAKNFYKFKKAAHEFLKKPSKDIFFKKKVKPLTSREFDKYMKSRGTEMVGIAFEPPKVVPDILWPQLRKTMKRLESILREYEFFVLRSECWTDENKLSLILFEMQVGKLPVIDKVIGPWVFDEKNAKNFIKKHETDAITGPFIEDNYWVVEVKRKWIAAKLKLMDSLDKDEKILKAKGIPNFIAKKISKKFKIIGENEIKKLIKNKEFGVFLRNYFEKEKLMI